MGKKFEDEEFRKIPGHENYSCSNYGRFKKGRKLIETKWDSSHEYKTICLDGKRMRAHRCVASIFCDNDDPENKTVVDHINNDKTDNRAENLRWCTIQENTQYAVEDGLRTYVRKGWLVAVNLETMEGQVYKTQKDAADALNIKSKQISSVLNGKKKSMGGYTFFRLMEINGITQERDEDGSYGRTAQGGSFAIATYDNVTMQLTDEREEYIQPIKLRDICLEYLKDKKYLAKDS